MDIKTHPALSRFIAAGAECTGGTVYLRRVAVALLRNDTVILTPEGEVELKRLMAKEKIEDVAVKGEPQVAAPAVAPARKTAKPKPAAAPEPDPIPPSSGPSASELDALLVGQGLATPMS